MTSQNPTISSYLMESVTSIIWKSAVAPLDRVKLLIQSQNEMIKQGSITRKYDGIINCFKRITRNEGIAALWRGNSANILKFFPGWGLNHALKGTINTNLVVNKEKGHWYWIVRDLASDVLVCNATLAFIYSLDYARRRLANDVVSANGFGPLALGLTVSRCLHFGLNGASRSIALVSPLKDSFLTSFFVSWTVTTAVTAICYPFDTISRRMMMSTGEVTRYKNGFECFKKIIASEGVGSLFKGCGTNMLIGVAGALVISSLHVILACLK
ncbi:uncharacterized protein RJT20DRAFT_145203 [Scheffersomyces xylosifermentans]|uniref:uncharacterized protein n=1 Tax=Scheffersomyces xylosifermentans TaxID=1304137 RepID=UPI00315DFEA7